VRCYSSSWLPWAAAALVGSAVYCLAAPVAIILAARNSEGLNSEGRVRSARRLVQVLRSTYRPKHASFEGMDLLRKFVLTGVITLVQPQTRIQLWFGAVSCLLFLQLHLRFQPYKSHFCNLIQAAALLQLLFTYLTAFLFFVDISQPQTLDGENRYLGLSLVAGNSLAYFLIFMSSIRGVLRLRRDVDQSRLTWDDGYTPVMLRPPTNPNGFHLFLSHVWKHAQDQAGTIKSSLVSLVPTCKVFLDVDDLEEVSRLEEYVQQTDVMVVIVTEGYISSFNCRRELVAMFKLNKPLVCVLESDPDKGGTSVAQLRGELDALQRSEAGLPSDHESACHQLIELVEQSDDARSIPSRVEWHRERVLKTVALRVLVANLLLEHQSSDPNAVQLTGACDRATVQGPDELSTCRASTEGSCRVTMEGSKCRPTMNGKKCGDTAPPRGKVRRQLQISHPLQLRVQEETQCLLHREWPVQAVHLDGGYRAISSGISGQSIFDEMRDRLSAINIIVSDSPVAAEAQIPTVVLLCPGFFEQPSLVNLLASTVEEAHLESALKGEHTSSSKGFAKQLAKGLPHFVSMRKLPTEHKSMRKVPISSTESSASVSEQTSHHLKPLPKLARRLTLHGTWKRRRSVSVTSGQKKLCLFSTARPFGFYIAQCRKHAPYLIDAGVFHNVFHKWPPSPLLQFAVAANHLHPLLPAPPSATLLEELRSTS